MPQLLVIKHVQRHNFGVIASICERLKLDIDLRTTPLGDPTPASLQGYVGLIILGGPDSVYDDKPYFKDDLDLIAKAEKAGIPFLGICLGAQLLAHYIGGEVYRGTLGAARHFSAIALQTDDAVFGHELTEVAVFQWHQDTFTLPETATILATDGQYPLQAFKWKNQFYGVQFHPEVDVDVVQRWARFIGLDASVPSLLHDAEKNLPAVHTWLEAFLQRLFRANP